MSEIKNNNLSTFVKRNLKNDFNHCDIIDLENFEITKPIVFCFGGNTTTNTREANGFCKIVESLLELLYGGGVVGNVTDNIDLIGASYRVTEQDDRGEAGELSDDDIDTIVDFILMPLCMDNCGKRLDVNSVCKNLSQVSFFTFCQGAKEVAKIFKNFDKKMLYIGFSIDEISEIKQSMKQVSYAPLVKDNPIPSLRILSARDFTHEIRATQISKRLFGEDFSGIAIRYDEIGKMYGKESSRSQSESVQIFSSNLLNGIRNVKDEHFADLLKRVKNWDIRSVAINGTRVTSKNADCVSQMVAWALSKIVESGIKNSNSKEYVPMNLQDLMEDLEYVKDTFSNEYLGTNKDYLHYEEIKTNPSELKKRRNKIMLKVCACKNYDEIIQVLEKYDAYDEISDFIPILWNLTQEEKRDLALLAYQKNLERNAGLINEMMDMFFNR